MRNLHSMTIVLWLFILVISLAGCSPSVKSDEEIIADLQSNPYFFQGVHIADYQIIKRQTDIKGKSDIVYISVEASNERNIYNLSYVMTYALYNKGWALDSVDSYDTENWMILDNEDGLEEMFSPSTNEFLCFGTATAKGFGGELEITVFVDANEVITEIDVKHNETAGVGTNAIQSLKNTLVGSSIIAVDAVTGATITSKAMIAATKEAYIIARAKSLGLTSYDEQNPLCGIWRWESNHHELEHAIWCIFPDFHGRWYLVEDDTDDENAYKLFDFFEFTYVTVDNSIIIDSIGAPLLYDWLNRDTFSLIVADDDDTIYSDYYCNAYRIPFE